jgi:hypothetical protein
MRRLICVCVVVIAAPALRAQTALKTIEDRALDNIQLFVPALERGPTLVVLIPVESRRIPQNQQNPVGHHVVIDLRLSHN